MTIFQTSYADPYHIFYNLYKNIVFRGLFHFKTNFLKSLSAKKKSILKKYLKKSNQNQLRIKLKTKLILCNNSIFSNNLYSLKDFSEI